jgi:glycosyltransferase involved in cell wall biosynthesis
MTLISVVVPTKDRLQHLQRAVPGFLAQEEVGEVIIVVDGCRDGTLDYVQALAASDRRVRFADNVHNRGLPYSRNRGIDLAECEYVFTGEDDLELTGDFFKTLLSHMHETAADIISGRNIFRFETETGAEAISRTDGIRGDAVNRRTIAVHTGIAASGDQRQLLLPAPMLGSTAIFHKIRFDEGYLVNYWREESDFQLSATECGYNLVYCPHAISFNFMIENDRGGAHSAAGARRVMWITKNNWRFVQKHRRLIEQEFDIGDPRAYITRFAIRRVYAELLVPILVGAKQRAWSVLRKRRALRID